MLKPRNEKKAEESFRQALLDIKGVGEELADNIMLRYKSAEDFKKNATLRNVIAVSGIGKDLAELIFKEIKETR